MLRASWPQPPRLQSQQCWTWHSARETQTGRGPIVLRGHRGQAQSASVVLGAHLWLPVCFSLTLSDTLEVARDSPLGLSEVRGWSEPPLSVFLKRFLKYVLMERLTDFFFVLSSAAAAAAVPGWVACWDPACHAQYKPRYCVCVLKLRQPSKTICDGSVTAPAQPVRPSGTLLLQQKYAYCSASYLFVLGGRRRGVRHRWPMWAPHETPCPGTSWTHA